MLKIFSAAVVATALLVAPAMAAGPRHAQPHAAPLNAKAQMMHRHHIRGHHHHHVRPHFRFHHKLGGAFHKHSAAPATVVHRHG